MFPSEALRSIPSLGLKKGYPFMQCPTCNVPLTLAERQGVEIDYCPNCRGVWLDRGELDKIIDRSFSEQAPPPRQPSPSNSYPSKGNPLTYRNDDDWYEDNHDKYRRKKKRGFLGEIFDFD